MVKLVTESYELTCKNFSSKEREIKSVKVLETGKEFNVGDYIENSKNRMHGHIERFELDETSERKRVFVYTDWSGVGFNIEAAVHKMKLPSKLQPEDPGYFVFGPYIIPCYILAVHFYKSKVKYDLELEHTVSVGGIPTHTTRTYMIDSVFVKSRKEVRESEEYSFYLKNTPKFIKPESYTSFKTKIDSFPDIDFSTF